MLGRGLKLSLRALDAFRATAVTLAVALSEVVLLAYDRWLDCDAARWAAGYGWYAWAWCECEEGARPCPSALTVPRLGTGIAIDADRGIVDEVLGVFPVSLGGDGGRLAPGPLLAPRADLEGARGTLFVDSPNLAFLPGAD